MKHIDNECLHYYDEEISACGCGFIGTFKKNNQVYDYNFSSSINEMIEEESEEELFEINWKEIPIILDSIEDDNSTVFSLDINNNNKSNDVFDDDVVYVAVGKGTSGSCSGMEALSWALKHAVTTTTTTVFLLHVFPQVKLIPTPLGKIPRSHVNLEHVNMYLTQVKSKRKLLIQKFINICVESKVKVEVLLIEGDDVAKAIVDLVGNLNIKKLVIGANQSNLRKHGSRRQNCIADRVLKSVQESCNIKIICEGKEVIEEMEMVNGCTSHSQQHSIVSNQELRGFVPPKLSMPNPLLLFRSKFLSPR